MAQPNILLIFADQHRFDCTGASGHPLLETPHLDRLAQEGASFTRAFTPAPICTPARCSLLTGLWPVQHGSLANEAGEAYRPMRAGLPTFSQTLKAHGYYLGYVGKWHVDEHRPPTDFGFDAYVPEAEYWAWRRSQGLPPRPRTNGYFGEVDPGITPEQSRLAWGADQLLAMLAQAAQRPQPFFIRWDPAEPHLPNIVPEPYASRYPPESIPPWPNFTDPLAHKPYIQRQQRQSWGIAGWTWEQWAPIVGRYLGEIALLDAQIGRVLAGLEALGLAEKTVVVYSADHGDLCGAHGMIDKHYVMYDEVVRVPLLLRWPGVIPPGVRCDAFVSTLDLASTFCDLAGAPTPPAFMGHSLLPLLAGRQSGREEMYASYHGNQFGLYSQRMVRTEQWKYVWNPTAQDELYDLEADPGEITNQAGDPAFAGVLAEMRRRLVRWLEQSGDPLLNQWTRRQLLEGCKL
ncbi:MAG TPA: sulfatase-like hydrolase/transferase [Caldilineaceae bacterium]|nr:sulfatase-like hydrolase/transferase [Caldilineaceae bacterium]